MKTLCLLFILSMCAFNIHAQTKRSTLQPPNILIILADDLGYRDVSYYGTKDIRTPNIDELCHAGLRFDHFYANSPVCSPSRASILSGRYPEMTGVPGLIRYLPEDNFGYLKPGIVLLPQLLKQKGYNTSIIGKWNLGLESPNLPNEKGFDYFHGWLDDMMEDYWKHERNNKNFLRENKKPITPQGHATTLFTEWAEDYIGQQKNSSKPFFLYLAYTAPHSPVQPTDEYLQKVYAREPGITEKRAKLVALIEQMDNGIGKVITSLKKNGLYENTLIIFLSDNGGHLEDGADNGNLRDGKGTMYEGGLRVPAFITWPQHIKANTVSRERIMMMDLYPTLGEIAAVKTLPAIDGVSFLPLLQDSTYTMKPRTLFFTRREGGNKFGGKTSDAIINWPMKLLQNTPYQPLELYNLQDDPEEQHNLINTTTGISQSKQLQDILMKHIQEGGKVPWQKEK